MKHLTLTTALGLLLAAPALAQDKPGEGVTVRTAIQPLLEEMFQSRILFRALGNLGYTVADPQEVVAQTAHIAVGAGDADLFPSSWHTLHDPFVQEAGSDAVVTKVGVLVDGALQGSLVDKASYDSGITNLGQLKDPETAKRFGADGDGKADLAGCVPGWGCERVIEHHLTEYDCATPSPTTRANTTPSSPTRSPATRTASRCSTTPGPPIGCPALWSPARMWNG